MRDFIIGLLYILVQIAIAILAIPLVIVVMAAIFTVGCIGLVVMLVTLPVYALMLLKEKLNDM